MPHMLEFTFEALMQWLPNSPSTGRWITWNNSEIKPTVGHTSISMFNKPKKTLSCFLFKIASGSFVGLLLLPWEGWQVQGGGKNKWAKKMKRAKWKCSVFSVHFSPFKRLSWVQGIHKEFTMWLILDRTVRTPSLSKSACERVMM